VAPSRWTVSLLPREKTKEKSLFLDFSIFDCSVFSLGELRDVSASVSESTSVVSLSASLSRTQSSLSQPRRLCLDFSIFSLSVTFILDFSVFSLCRTSSTLSRTSSTLSRTSSSLSQPLHLRSIGDFHSRLLRLLSLSLESR